MSYWTRKAVLAIELAAYLTLVSMVAVGAMDSIARSIALPWAVPFGIVGIAIVAQVATYRWAPGILTSFRALLWICLAAITAAHLTIGGADLSPLQYRPTLVLYLAVVVAYAALGNLRFFLSALIILGAGELVGVVGNSIFESYPLVEGQLAAMGAELAAALPGIGLITGIGALAWGVSAARSNNALPETERAKAPTSLNATEVTAEPQPAEQEGRAKTRSFSLDYISELQNAESEHLDNLLASVVFFMSRNFRPYSSLGFIFDPQSQSFVLNASSSRCMSIKPHVRIPVGSGVVGRLGSEKRSFLSGDVANYGLPLLYYSGSEMINSILAVPIISDSQELLGALVIDSRDKSAFKEQDKEVLKRFSSLAAALITNMRMRIRQERSARHFHMLFETAHHFTTALDASKVFEILFDMLPRVTTFSSATAITFDPNANTQTVRKCLGRPAPFREGIVLPINDGLYSAVYRKNERIHLPDLATMQGRFYRLAPDEPRSTGRSLLALPLADDELHCRGLVALEGDMPHQFDGVVEQVISTLVDSAAVALVRALLYHNMVMLATTDGLTHLCNHRSFQERLEKELERSGRYERKLSLLLMDIDHFKSFNDTYGHPVGDLVLREIAGCIRRSVRSNDIPARYGGEEFTVVIPETDEQGAMITAERIRQTIEQHVIRTDSKELHVTVSIGCATFPDLATTQQALIDAADKALYYSKEHGRNRCTLYRRPM